jgi:hypothetical protein
VIASLLIVLAAAPVEARFGLEVGGIPVAELRISVAGNRYVYESTHFLEEGPRAHRVELSLSKSGPLPEVLVLAHKPKPGCREVLEERTRAVEQLCVEQAGKSEVTGTIDGDAFVARYGEDEKLMEITVGSAHWFSMSKALQPPAESPFVRGVSVPPGSLRLEPPVEGARWLTQSPRGIGKPETVGRVRCLVLAREEARRRGAQVSVGLVIEGGRAFPHAWVTERGAALDPSVLDGDSILAERRYLEVPAGQSGRFYLRFFDGAVKLKAP